MAEYRVQTLHEKLADTMEALAGAKKYRREVLRDQRSWLRISTKYFRDDKHSIFISNHFVRQVRAQDRWIAIWRADIAKLRAKIKAKQGAK